MSSSFDPDRRWSRRTLAAHAMGAGDARTGAIVPPVHLSTTYIRDPDNQYRSGYSYGRPDNATVRETEAVIAMLEDAASAKLFSSGTAAATSLFLALAPGDHIVAPAVMYWALRKWLLTDGRHWGLETSFVDGTDPQAWRAAIIPGRTKLVWTETPSNPLWQVFDIEALAGVAHEAGARLAVDSTAATPVHTRPLALGADIVMHSATKALNGHSDVLAGVLAARAKDEFWARIVNNRKSLGCILGPFEAWLLMRGLRTLELRVNQASANALELARRFANHPHVHDVLYPGLETHPGHKVAARQMQGGFGHMLSIRARGGEQGAIAAAAHVALWRRATSLGGVESLIEHRASIEGEGTPCPPDLLRLSAGIEDVEDLYADLDAALRTAHA